jgi:putative MATE family efflux protein
MNVESKSTFTEGVIWKKILLFFIPIVIGTFFQHLYNTIDAIIAGRYISKQALSAVGGTTGTLISLLVDFFVGVSTGATVIISQFYGGKKVEDVKKTIHTAIALALVGGAFIMFIGITLAPNVLQIMHTPDDIMNDAISYIRIYFFGIIPLFIYNICAGILRAVGDSKKPLLFLVISCFTNIILDCFFTIVLKMDVAGLAIATVLSQIISTILICHYLIKSNEIYSLEIKKVRFDKEKIKNILKIGIPAGFQSLMFSITNIISQSNINKFGTDSITAWTAYTKIGGLYFMIVSAFGVSITTFVGQNYGAGQKQRVRQGIRQGLIMTLISTLIVSTLFFVFGKKILFLFTKDKQVLEIGTNIVHFMAPTYFTYICVEILSGSLRGMGESLKPMCIIGFGVCFLRIVWLLFAVPVWFQVETVIASLPISWSITSLLFIFYYLFYIRKKEM